MAGLTYYQMVYYAARLRVENEVWFSRIFSSSGANAALENRVSLVLELMGLSKMKNRLIGERPVLRGELGATYIDQEDKKYLPPSLRFYLYITTPPYSPPPLGFHIPPADSVGTPEVLRPQCYWATFPAGQ